VQVVLSGTKCKKKNKGCKNACPTNPDTCPACEDNTISVFGTFWCEMNVDAAGFCTEGEGKTKCNYTSLNYMSSGGALCQSGAECALVAGSATTAPNVACCRRNLL
jgi:hypothetical protein